MARPKKPKPIIEYISEGKSIQDIIDAFAARGITNLDSIKFNCATVYCDDECYNVPSYDDLRFEVIPETN